MENSLHTVIGILLAIMFAAFTVLQFNDPDPITWVAVYGLMLGLVIFNIYKPLPQGITVILMVFAVAGAFLLWPKEFHGLRRNMDRHPSVELARESLGLLICAAVCFYMTVRAYFRTKKSAGMRLKKRSRSRSRSRSGTSASH